MKILIKTLLLALCLMSISSLGAQHEQDTKDIKQLVQKMATAWSNADGATWAEPFAEKHNFIVWFGMYLPESTREMNAISHQKLFEGQYKNTTQYAIVDRIDYIRDDIAMIYVLAAVTKDGEPKPEIPDVLWSGLLEKGSKGWQILSFHNLDLEILKDPEMAKFSPLPLDVMFRSWNM